MSSFELAEDPDKQSSPRPISNAARASFIDVLELNNSFEGTACLGVKIGGGEESSDVQTESSDVVGVRGRFLITVQVNVEVVTFIGVLNERRSSQGTRRRVIGC